MKHRITILLTLVLLASVAFVSPAQAAFSKVGTTGAAFLKIGVGRATAMGDAFVAIADDASASYFNPAGLARVNRQIALNHVDWIADVTHENLAIVLPMSNFGTVAFTVTALAMGQIEQTTIDNPNTVTREDEGTGLFFGASDMAFAISYARLITDKLSFGVTTKVVNQSIWDMLPRRSASTSASSTTPDSSPSASARRSPTTAPSSASLDASSTTASSGPTPARARFRAPTARLRPVCPRRSASASPTTSSKPWIRTRIHASPQR